MSTELLKSMYSGMEDIENGIVSDDSIYASALMGGEGFMDGIKKGAAVTLDFIKRVLNMILDAVLLWFGGRDNVKRKFDQLKRSKFFSMFKNDITNKVEKVSLPASAVAGRFIESAVDVEYQDFFSERLKETPEITKFYVEVNKLSGSILKFCRDAKANPREEHLDLEPHLQGIKSCVESARKLTAALSKEKEPDQAIIKNINGTVLKLGKATNVLVSAQKVISKGLDELILKAEDVK